MCRQHQHSISIFIAYSSRRRYNTNDRMLRYNRTRADMFMDTMHASHPNVTSAYMKSFGVKPRSISTRQNSCAQVFVTEFEMSISFR